jgi:hypothetical protein
MRAFHTCSGIRCKRGLADFGEQHVLNGAQFVQKGGSAFVSHKRNVSLAWCFVNMDNAFGWMGLMPHETGKNEPKPEANYAQRYQQRWEA